MPEQSDTRSSNDDAKRNAPNQSHASRTESHTPATQSEKCGSDQKAQSATQLQVDIRAGERWLIWIGIASVLVNFLIALIYLGQLNEMRKATAAASDSARAAKDAADLARQGNELTIHDSALNQRLSRAALEASISASRMDQRAWVGVNRVDTLIEHEKSTEVSVHIKNTGKTPALNTHAVLLFEWRPRTVKPSLNYSERDAKGNFTLVPGDEVTVSVKKPVFTLDQVNQVNAGTTVIYVAGTIWYRDIFQRRLKTMFCFTFDKETQGMVPCTFPIPPSYSYRIVRTTKFERNYRRKGDFRLRIWLTLSGLPTIQDQVGN